MGGNGDLVRHARPLIVAVIVGLALASTGRADTLDGTEVPSEPINRFLTYTTTGSVGGAGVDGPNVVSFSSVSDGGFTAPSSISLGEFVSAALPVGTVAEYSEVPWFTELNIDGVADPIRISGVLNGSVSGATQNSIVATFDQVDPIEFTGDDGYQYSLTILDTELSLVPSTTNRGRTTAQARVVVNQVPEPATVAVFATAIAGLAIRRHLRRSAVKTAAA